MVGSPSTEAHYPRRSTEFNHLPVDQEHLSPRDLPVSYGSGMMPTMSRRMLYDRQPLSESISPPSVWTASMPRSALTDAECVEGG